MAALAALAPVAGAQTAPRLTRCSGQARFGCGTLNVPLDYSGRVPGTIGLRFAAQRSFPRTGKVLFALTGGPGQGGVEFATSQAASLEPALRQYRLVTLDQRGTGRSGALSCPRLQRLLPLDATTAPDVAACAARIGPRRAFYTTADTVLDLESLRKALGAQKVALMGVSYGTHVALQYARAFPQNVDRLILDSIVGPSGLDPFQLDTFRNLGRVLREQCARGRCRGVTADPVGDEGALVTRLNAPGPLRGSFFDDRGRPKRTLYRNPDEIANLIIAGDLNPLLRAALPGAIAAARRGDTAELMRLRRIAQGTHLTTRELSAGLQLTTDCLDMSQSLPYSIATTPVAARPPIAQAALAAIPPAQYAPFDAGAVLRTSYVQACIQWPNDVSRLPFTGPLPDVPALLLGGRLDTRTPIENARATATQLPHASVVTLPGSGHDAIDNDLTGCIGTALERFIAGRTVGQPCRGRNTGFSPEPRPPRSLNDFRSAPGVGGKRGRALFAVLDTVRDAILTSLQLELAELPSRAGGLRGGRFRISDAGMALRMTRYSFVPGLRVTGTLRATSTADTVGRLSVQGPRGASGFVRVTANRAIGRLGGRPFVFRTPSAAAAAARAGARGVGALRPWALLRRLARGPARPLVR